MHVCPVGSTKTCCYEKPYTITGGVRREGSKREPKDTSQNDLLERCKLATWMVLSPCEVLNGKGLRPITILSVSESSGTVPMKH
ncbi:hypothetical protein D1872_161580 [compost metagenome]